jgi:hypothetical protein
MLSPDSPVLSGGFPVRFHALVTVALWLPRFLWAALDARVSEYRRSMHQRHAFDEIWAYVAEYDPLCAPESVDAPLPTERIDLTPSLVVLKEARPEGFCYKLVTINVEAIWILPADALYKDMQVLWERMLSPAL